MVTVETKKSKNKKHPIVTLILFHSIYAVVVVEISLRREARSFVYEYVCVRVRVCVCLCGLAGVYIQKVSK